MKVFTPKQLSCSSHPYCSLNVNFQPFDVPNNECIMSVSQRPEAMWVLTAAGNIFIRVGLSANSLHGSHWESLDLNQIGMYYLLFIYMFVRNIVTALITSILDA